MGSEFKILLRNKLTQKAIAHEYAEWIRRKVKFKSNKTKENIMGFGIVDKSSHTLTLLYSRPDSKIGYFRRWTSSVRLKNGNYRALHQFLRQKVVTIQKIKIYKAQLQCELFYKHI